MTEGPVSDLSAMLAGMDPVLDHRPYRFETHPSDNGDEARAREAFAVIREDEATTLVVETRSAGGAADFARITLRVHSDLHGVGLTAAVSRTLAEAGIACNVIAGFNHDHVFVPWPRREEALARLKRLSDDARR